MPERVAILGASDKPDRYAHQAMLALQRHGHTPLPVNPHHDTIDGVPCVSSLADLTEPPDTITVYVRPAILTGLVLEIIAAAPRRVILNPGTEEDAIRRDLEAAGIRVQEACTLVLLSTGQFEAG